MGVGSGFSTYRLAFTLEPQTSLGNVSEALPDGVHCAHGRPAFIFVDPVDINSDPVCLLGAFLQRLRIST